MRLLVPPVDHGYAERGDGQQGCPLIIQGPGMHYVHRLQHAQVHTMPVCQGVQVLH
jgi:hypothetical protein